MTNLGRRLWEDVQVVVFGSLLASSLPLLAGQGFVHVLPHFWRSLLWMVPCTFVGTELARSLHGLILLGRLHKASVKLSKPKD